MKKSVRLSTAFAAAALAAAALAGCASNGSSSTATNSGNKAPSSNGITTSKPTSVMGDVEIFTIQGRNFTCHVSDNTQRYEGPGLSCTRTNDSPLKHASIVTGDGGEVQLVVDPATGCFVAENNQRYTSSAISCPTPPVVVKSAATPKPAAPKS